MTHYSAQYQGRGVNLASHINLQVLRYYSLSSLRGIDHWSFPRATTRHGTPGVRGWCAAGICECYCYIWWFNLFSKKIMALYFGAAYFMGPITLMIVLCRRLQPWYFSLCINSGVGMGVIIVVRTAAGTCYNQKKDFATTKNDRYNQNGPCYN